LAFILHGAGFSRGQLSLNLQGGSYEQQAAGSIFAAWVFAFVIGGRFGGVGVRRDADS
jgi:hypothetical protein